MYANGGGGGEKGSKWNPFPLCPPAPLYGGEDDDGAEYEISSGGSRMLDLDH